MKSLPDRSRGEEISNSITHGIMVPFGIYTGYCLAKARWNIADPIGMFSIIAYSFSLTFLMLNSCIYHGLDNPKWKRFFRYLDHISIYVQITGSFTPCMLLSCRNWYGYGIVIYLFTLSIIGSIIKIFFFDKIFGAIFYLTMAYSTLAIYNKVRIYFHQEEMAWLIKCAIVYTVGCVFYALQKKVPYFHTIFHLFVNVGAYYHYKAIQIMNNRSILLAMK